MTANGPNPGPGVDAQGRPVIDPTENVKALTEAAVDRLNDLQEAERRFTAAELRHLRDVAELRAFYEDKLREAEAKRLDAIRSVDVGAVDRAAKEAIERANTLATQVSTTALAFDSKLAAALDPIGKDIADLRRSQYEGIGQKTQVVEGRAGFSAAYAGIAAVIGLVLFAITLYGALKK